MAEQRATGYVRVIQRKDGPVAYAKLKLPDGSQPCPKLGRLWTKRSRPPAGYITMEQAQRRLGEILAGEDPLVTIAPSHVMFKTACDEYVSYLEHQKQRKASTLADYRNVIKHDLLDHFGEDTPVEKITTGDVEALRADLLDRVSHRTTQKVLVLLHGVMARAARKGWVRVNPCEAAERVTLLPSDTFNILTPEQVSAIARATQNPLLGELFIVAAFTGLRCPGELLALRWGHVDFTNRIVHVQRNYVMGVEGTPKGKRRRSVPLADQAFIALDGLSRRKEFTDPDDLVFCTVAGERLSGSDIRDAFYAALDAAKLGHLREGEDPIVAYDLRHTFASLAVRKAPLSTVQAWMGHQDISTTMRYVHYVPQHDAAALLTEAFTSESVHPDVHRTPDLDPHLA